MAEKEMLKDSWLLREINDDDKERLKDSPAQSILRTPTAVFTTTESTNKNVRRLTFADSLKKGTDSREGSTDSTRSFGVHNGDASKVPEVEVIVSPIKSIRVSPDAWKCHLFYRRSFPDYANQMVKTDYTYSWLSPYHNKELAPGFPVRPNMSRLPIRAARLSDVTDSPSKTEVLSRKHVSTSSPWLSPSKLTQQWTRVDSEAVRRLNFKEENSLKRKLMWWMLLLAFLLVLHASGIVRNIESAVGAAVISLLKSAIGGLYNLLLEIGSYTKEYVILFGEAATTMALSKVSPFMRNQASLQMQKEQTLKEARIKAEMNVFQDILKNQRAMEARLQYLYTALGEMERRRDALKKLESQMNHLTALVTPRPCHRRCTDHLELESRLHRITSEMKSSFSNISSEMRKQMHALSVDVLRDMEFITSASINGRLDIQGLIREALNLYDADKTGRADFALESSGGRVVGTRCTEPYDGGKPSDPSMAIRPGRALGECWSFQGEGRLVIELSHQINVTGCSMEHVPHSIHPFGFTSSAPRVFSLWGLRNVEDDNPHLFGSYIFSINTNESVQYFPIKDEAGESFKIIELGISSNHGHVNYTCLYRIRIHGKVSES